MSFTLHRGLFSSSIPDKSINISAKQVGRVLYREIFGFLVQGMKTCRGQTNSVDDEEEEEVI